MADNNVVESHDLVVGTQGLVLSYFIDLLREEMPELKFVYDEPLDYESAIARFRADNDMENETCKPFPLFAFRRSVLRYPEAVAPGRRSINEKVTYRESDTSDSVTILRSVHAVMDVDFLYITDVISDLENFEVAYLSEEGISACKTIEVPIPTDLGGNILPYYAEYLPLEEKLITQDGNYYKTVSGQIQIKGFYLVLRGSGGIIREINTRIQEIIGAPLLSNLQITA